MDEGETGAAASRYEGTHRSTDPLDNTLNGKPIRSAPRRAGRGTETALPIIDSVAPDAEGSLNKVRSFDVVDA